MPAESTESRKPPQRAKLTPEKGREVLGIVLLAAGLILLVSLASHHPLDPSAFHDSGNGARAHNLIGRFGAQLSAFAFQFLGPTSFVLPILLLAAGWRRVRHRDGTKVVGRGIGTVLLLGSLPGFLQLVVGDVLWQGLPIHAGGALGAVLAEALENRMNFAGALVVLAAGVTIGVALVVQRTLGDVLKAWRARIAQFFENRALARARRRERREKEKARERVVTKHLQRVQEERAKETPPPRVERPQSDGGAAEYRLDLPLRVTEKPGEGEFSVRRVRGAAETTSEPAAPAPRPAAPPARQAKAAPEPPAPTARRAPPQEALPFSAPPSERQLPPLNLLQLGADRGEVDEDELVRLGEVIRLRCAEFGVEGTVEGISPGPVITVFEFQPAPGVKVSQIVNLQDDLALALKAESVRIDRIPGRSTLGIEVPNKKRAVIRLGHLLDQETFQRAPSVLTMAIGMTIHGEPYYADLATMPHLLVAGATGSGKSVGLQSMITSIIYKATREDVQFIFIDPKRIELGVYADIPHLKAEVVVEPKKAANALRWAVAEMERRYRLLAEVHVRSIDYYNRAIKDPEVQKRLSLTDGESSFRAEDFKPLPYYVIVIDELADLMMVSSAEVETAIARLAQMARAVGIHLIVATQRPSVDVLTGTIKANFPCRISFATASRHDSRTILDQVGSEKLLGKGDMLFMPPGTSRVMRLHGAYISEQETAGLIRWLKKLGRPELDPAVLAAPEAERVTTDGGENDDDLYDEAARLVVAERMASASFLQRRMRIGFSRAARLIDMMERDGLLGPQQGSKPRDVLVKPDYFEEIDRVRQD